MPNTLETILNEMYDGNTISNEYSNEYIQRLLKAREYNPLDSVPVDEIDDGDVYPEDFHLALVQFIHSGEDELSIQYEDGTLITLEAEIVKELVAKCSTEDLEQAALNSTFLADLIERVSDEVIEWDEIADDGEDYTEDAE